MRGGCSAPRRDTGKAPRPSRRKNGRKVLWLRDSGIELGVALTEGPGRSSAGLIHQCNAEWAINVDVYYIFEPAKFHAKRPIEFPAMPLPLAMHAVLAAERE